MLASIFALVGFSAPNELAQVPALAAFVERAAREPEAVAQELAATFPAFIANEVGEVARGSGNASIPVVLAHGMGDSCFNDGMKSITKLTGDHLGVYSTCIPTGNNKIMDTINGFLMNMDKSVDEFAKRVKADPKLANGFNAYGMSQGNNLIRGWAAAPPYPCPLPCAVSSERRREILRPISTATHARVPRRYIQKYNDPPVHTFMSICGINAGVAAFPQCGDSAPIIGGVCRALTEVLGDLAYLEVAQSILFQANYFRDPTHVGKAQYKKNSQLAAWNGEGDTLYGSKANFLKTDKFIWVEGTRDTEVWPRGGEQWQQVSPDYPSNLKVVPMNESTWYTSDAFGLKTADLAGKHNFESFPGNHIRFTQAELIAWLDKYFA